MSKIDRYKEILENYPIMDFCLDSFINWITVNWDSIPVEKDFFILLEENDHEVLSQIELKLAEAQRELSIDLDEFCRIFGFKTDLLCDEEEKIYDVLAEPIFVSDLLGLGFRNVKKLPKSIKCENKKHLKCADFIAEHGVNKFAIELKTIRMENKPRPTPGKPIGDSRIPGWWHKMFINNVRSKILGKNYGVIEQLENTASRFECNKKMIAIYNRRISSSTLIDADDLIKHSKEILDEFNAIDYFLLKNYFGGIDIHPKLP